MIQPSDALAPADPAKEGAPAPAAAAASDAPTRFPPPSARARSIAFSLIREIAEYGRFGADGVTPLWFGESDEPTPAFIVEAAQKALAEGRTFYTPNLGIPPLREAIAAYHGRVGRRPVSPERVAVTASGVHGLYLATQLVASPGDRVLVQTPHWPNVLEMQKLAGARAETFALDPVDGGWRLDLDRFLAAITPETRAVIVNSPSNPTGWTLAPEEISAILAHCRKRGVWIVSDEVYERISFERAAAPSFLDVAEPDDRVVIVNSFSKSWAMTGWRVGWLVAPPSVMDWLGNVIEFNSSCANAPALYGALAAVRDGDAWIEGLRTRLQAARDRTIARLADLPGVRVAPPAGAMYAFLDVDLARFGAPDSVTLAKRIIDSAKVGLAPGRAFGPVGEGRLRLCFAAREAALTPALDRLAAFFHTAARG